MVSLRCVVQLDVDAELSVRLDLIQVCKVVDVASWLERISVRSSRDVIC